MVEEDVENTSLPQDYIRLVWEVLPGDVSRIFPEICQGDIDSSLFSPVPVLSADNFPVELYPRLEPVTVFPDRVWTQTVIKIDSDIVAWSSKKTPEPERVYDINANNKGLVCPIKSVLCQEGWCRDCCIYLDRPS